MNAVHQTERRYGPAYFREVEAHWGRMVAGAPNKLEQFNYCLIEGAACIRIAGYSPDTFRAVFTEIAQTNGLVKRMGGDDALRSKLNSTIDALVTNYAETVRKNREQLRLIINDKPPNLFNQIDDILKANDGDQLKAFLDGLPPPDARRALTYIDRRIS